MDGKEDNNFNTRTSQSHLRPTVHAILNWEEETIYSAAHGSSSVCMYLLVCIYCLKAQSADESRQT